MMTAMQIRDVLTKAVPPEMKSSLDQDSLKTLLDRITAHLSEIPNEELNTLQGGLAILQTVFTPFVFKNSGSA